MHRRTLLKGLGAVSLWTATRGAESLVAAQSNSNTVTLNVILHGLFVMQFTQQNIQLRTPYVSEHRYLVSGWDPNNLSPLSPKSQPFELKGVPQLKPYDPYKLTRAVVLSQKQYHFHVDPSHSYVSISLPWPNDIALLRFAKSSTGGNIFKYPPLDGVTELSLCQALIYPGATVSALALTGTTWKPTVDPAFQTVNMHLWAEPDHLTTAAHSAEAYQRLGELLTGLNFKLAGNDVTANIDQDTGVKGLPTDQEKGLSEWLWYGNTTRKAKKTEENKEAVRLFGTDGSNCGLTVVVD